MQDTNANGSQGNGSAVVSVHRTIVLAAGQSTTGALLTDLQTFCRSLPNWTAYFLQTAGAVGASFYMQFSVDDVWNGAAMVPQWFNENTVATLTPPPAITPSYVTRRMAVNFLRPVITAPVGNGVTVEYILSVSL